VLAEVEDVLLNREDYMSALEQLAQKYGARGPEIVVCVVSALLDDWMARPRAGAEGAVATGRAKAFLREAGSKVER
jgi:hypothetical protein